MLQILGRRKYSSSQPGMGHKAQFLPCLVLQVHTEYDLCVDQLPFLRRGTAPAPTAGCYELLQGLDLGYTLNIFIFFLPPSCKSIEYPGLEGNHKDNQVQLLCFISWGGSGPALPPLYKKAFQWEKETSECRACFANSKDGPFALNFFADQINSEAHPFS